VSFKVALNDLDKHVDGHIDLFVSTASFEDRCLSLATKLAARIGTAVIVRASEYENGASVNRKRLEELFAGRLEQAVVSAKSPLTTATVLAQEVVSRMDATNGGSVFVDITTFTHEHVLILLALIKGRRPNCRIQCGYTGAAEYSTNTDEEGVWLSRGVRQVRSILGYPGGLLPSRRLHLVVLVGFESDRASTLIEIMEPSRLSLGVGHMEQSISPHHYARNERFAKQLGAFLDAQTRIQADVERFTFSCVDPLDAQEAVRNQAKKFSEFNTVVCPMNTKISTIGVGLAALSDTTLQVVYAAPEEYNELGYSAPGEYATLFRLDVA